jgi:hypothetical protein
MTSKEFSDFVIVPDLIKFVPSDPRLYVDVQVTQKDLLPAKRLQTLAQQTVSLFLIEGYQ